MEFGRWSTGWRSATIGRGGREIAIGVTEASCSIAARAGREVRAQTAGAAARKRAGGPLAGRPKKKARNRSRAFFLSRFRHRADSGHRRARPTMSGRRERSASVCPDRGPVAESDGMSHFVETGARREGGSANDGERRQNQLDIQPAIPLNVLLMLSQAFLSHATTSFTTPTMKSAILLKRSLKKLPILSIKATMGC